MLSRTDRAGARGWALVNEFMAQRLVQKNKYECKKAENILDVYQRIAPVFLPEPHALHVRTQMPT
jgi:hypothetical protein